MINLTEEDINVLFNVIDENVDEKNTETLTKEMFEEEWEFNDWVTDESKEKLLTLVGYEIEKTVDGDHRNDGQFVDYSFILTNKENEHTELNTEMCLQVGWNFNGSSKIH